MASSQKQAQSHWGWGWADKFGDRDHRAALGQMAKAMLGLDASPPKEPLPIEDVVLPDCRLAPPDALSSWVFDDPRRRIFHTYGRSFPEIWRGFHGDFSRAPDLVATPRDEQQLLALMQWAEEENIALVPYGGGTSVVGGVTPGEGDAFSGWVSVDLGRFDEVGAIHHLDRTARIGAGARGPAIEEALAREGMTLRHFPQSFEFSTLGGWLATRAGGHFATNYTRIDDLTQSLRMVTPRGVWETSAVPSTGAGPDPRALILGSEGSLGFITSATMRLRPQPRFRSRADVLFDNLQDAVNATRRIAQSYLFPSNCRLLDRFEALFNGVVTEPAHVLLLGFESADVDVSTQLEQALAIALGAGGRCPAGPRHQSEEHEKDARARQSDAAARWRQAFFEGPYLQSQLLSVGIVADTFETALRWEHFFDFHKDLKASLTRSMAEVAGKGKLTLRFTHVYPDGPAPYYTFLFAPPQEKTLEAWEKVRFCAADVIARHQATITHHHAVGRLHTPWWRQERAPLFQEAFAAVKATVDPRGLLNPGVFGLPR